jgi:hypothetical protein
MARSTCPVGAGLLVVFLLAGQPPPVLGQAPSPLTRLVSSDEKKFQGELDRAVADGYRLVGGSAGVEIAIFERADHSATRSYLFARDVETFFIEQKLPPGYRLVASTFGADELWFGAIFERVDDLQRAYRFVKAKSTSDIRKKLVDEGGARGATVLAITAGGGGVAVILEDSPDAAAVAVASGNTAALTSEISAAASKGLCLVDGDGIKGAVFVLQGCAAGQVAPAYHVLSTAKTGTFEKELNAATADGRRFVASSLIGVEKKALMTYALEFVGLVETTASAGPQSTYRLLATSRLGTLAKELEEAAQEGYRFVAFTLGQKQWLAVMEKH